MAKRRRKKRTTRTYKKVSCHTKKSTAKAKQKSMHNNGFTARLVQNGKKWCVESAGKRK